MNHRKAFSSSWWPLLAAGSLLLTGCDDWSRPVRAEAGLAARVQASVATSALATAWRAASPSVGTESAAAGRGDRAVASMSPKPSDRAAGPGPAPTPQVAEMRIRRLVLARDVEAREPVGTSETFDLDEVDKIYAFVEVNNREEVESEIFVTFVPEHGPARGHVRLRVGASPRWRTWAFTRGVRKTGKWTAVVRNADGELLARKSFDVTSASAAAKGPTGRSG